MQHEIVGDEIPLNSSGESTAFQYRGDVSVFQLSRTRTDSSSAIAVSAARPSHLNSTNRYHIDSACHSSRTNNDMKNTPIACATTSVQQQPAANR